MIDCKNISLQSILDIPLVLLSAVLPISFNEQLNRSKLPSKEPGRDDEGKCELIGTFSLLTQAVLGLLCLSSLLVKRYYEFPVRRSWPVWSFDVSKQLIGALGVHVFNVLLSILKTRKSNEFSSSVDGGSDDDTGSDDPCDWYFLSIVFDCTIGVYILYLVFQTLNRFCKNQLHVTQIDSGSYGPNPNKPSTRAFLKQLAVYFTSLMITKFIIYGLVECFETQLLWFTSHVLLLWLDEYPDELEIIIVMFVVPIVMNCLQLILIDNFIRNQTWASVNKRLEGEEQRLTPADAVDESEVSAYVVEQGQDRIKHIRNYNSDSSNSTYASGDESPKNYGTFNAV